MSIPKTAIIEKVAGRLNNQVERRLIEIVLDAAGHFELLARAKRMCDRMYDEQSKMEMFLRKWGVPLG